MDHNTLPAPQFELPRPQPNTSKEGLAPLEGDQDLPQQTERRNIETPAAPAPVSPAQAAQSVAQAGPTAGTAGILPVQPPAPIPAQAPANDDLIAEDNDLIEKAWVQKAKAIVEHTKNDPYRQNAEINKVKKDYIQKRYHKDIKLSDE